MPGFKCFNLRTLAGIEIIRIIRKRQVTVRVPFNYNTFCSLQYKRLIQDYLLVLSTKCDRACKSTS